MISKRQLMALAACAFAVMAWAQHPTVEELETVGLPWVEVTTVGGEEPTCDYLSPPPYATGHGITNATKVPGRLRIIDSGECVYDSGDFDGEDGGMTIKIRGNSSAYQAKKPYKVRLRRKADLLPLYRLVNMDGRMYDYTLGRFLSPDDYVQEPGSSQSYNRYTYCLNNPLKYSDPSGEVWWAPIVIGAVIGSTISATTYAISTRISSNKWNNKDFIKSIGFGALTGALSAGISQISTSMGLTNVITNKIGFKLLSQTTNNIITNVLFGNKMDWSDLAGIASSTIVSSMIPDYKAVTGSSLLNSILETSHNTLIGAASGLAQGTTKAFLKDNASLVIDYIIGGALSGFSRTMVHNFLLGAPFIAKNDVRNSSQNGIIRKGGLIGVIHSIFNISDNGIALGRHAYTDDGSIPVQAHEFYHINDIEKMGWISFYSRWLKELIHNGFKGMYIKPGTLEYNAMKHMRKYYQQ